MTLKQKITRLREANAELLAALNDAAATLAELQEARVLAGDEPHPAIAAILKRCAAIAKAAP